jgi:nucleotide-binding universal stress UspA family protein
MDGAEVLVISITQDPHDPARETELETRLQAYVDTQKEDLHMDGVLTLGGAVASEIRNAAEDMGVDLVVMASHEPRIDDYLFGSRSASVALHTQCSVMVVR